MWVADDSTICTIKHNTVKPVYRGHLGDGRYREVAQFYEEEGCNIKPVFWNFLYSTLFCMRFRGKKIKNPVFIKDLGTYINLSSFERSLKWPFQSVFSFGVNNNLWLQNHSEPTCCKKSLKKKWLKIDISFSLIVPHISRSWIYSSTIQLHHEFQRNRTKPEFIGIFFVTSLNCFRYEKKQWCP